jgi:hypothetical protein
MKSKLKLFVWEDFAPDWSGGLAFAIAHDETEARKMIEENHSFSPSDWGKLSVHRLDRRCVYSVSGGS